MKSRQLGRSRLVVSAEGLGCMGMSQSYGVGDDEESIATIHLALERGVTLIDTSDVYAKGRNEELVGKALVGRRSEAVVATKFGVSWTADRTMLVDGTPENARRCCEGSLQRLGIDHIDLYYLHRVDPCVPIEETVGAMKELVEAGKVRHIGLSEASAATLRRASAVHPIAALQSEWSLWTRDIEIEIAPVARELGIGIVPYSPLGRGFLTGAIKSPNDFVEGDVRRGSPRFQGENFERNLRLVDSVTAIAEEKDCTPGQLALAWVVAQGDDVVPIPGTKRRKYLEENIGAVDVEITPEDLGRLDALAPIGVAAGGRYAAAHAYGDTPEQGAGHV